MHALDYGFWVLVRTVRLGIYKDWPVPCAHRRMGDHDAVVCWLDYLATRLREGTQAYINGATAVWENNGLIEVKVGRQGTLKLLDGVATCMPGST
jgi:hypothetical protein